MTENAGESSLPEPSVASFRAVDWQAEIADLSGCFLHEYTGRFYSAMRGRAAKGETDAAEVFECLGDACSLHLRLGNLAAPYQRGVVTPTGASRSIDELAPAAIEAFRLICGEVANPQVRGRLGDVVWVRVRDVEAARVAISAYLEIAEAISQEGWPKPWESLERAAQIASQLGREQTDHVKVRDFIQNRLNTVVSDDRGYLSAKLIALLLAHGAGDAGRMGEQAATLGEQALEAKDWWRSRRYFEVGAEAFRRARSTHRARELSLRLAETFVSEAEHHVKGGSKLVAANALQQAVEAFRRAGNARERVEVLLAQLTELQREGIAELQVISHSMDVSAIVAEADQAAKGKSLGDALLALATSTRFPRVIELRKQAEERAATFIGQSLFPKVLLNKEGKVVARQASVRSSESTERDASIRADMLEAARHHHDVTAQAIINPIRLRIIAEHQLEVDDLLPIVRNNPFVPAGREHLFAEGLVAGFYGDLVTATCVLAPQVEHSVRVLLHTHGVRVSGLDKEGVQHEFGLNTLLYMEALGAIFDESQIFALQGLLVEEFGSNLRNKVAHGLMDHGEFQSWAGLYLWWTIVHLCMMPILVRMARKESEESRQVESTSTGN